MEKTDKVQFIDAFKKRTKKFVVDNIFSLENYLKQKKQESLEGSFCAHHLPQEQTIVPHAEGRSRAEFFSKMSIVVEEMDESVFWMEILIESQVVTEIRMRELLKEANEILAVVSSARKTASIKK